MSTPAFSRSMGTKLLIVCVLALFLLIPVAFVKGLVEDRAARSGDVLKEVTAQSGGEQTFLGPTIAVPYKIAAPEGIAASGGTYAIFPVDASGAVKTATEERRRSLFRVPVYQADLKLDATFDLRQPPAALPRGAQLDWDAAEIVVGVSDPHAALADAVITGGGKTARLLSSFQPDFPIAAKPQARQLKLLSAPMAQFGSPGARFSVSASLKFSGARHIAVLCYGGTTRLTAQGDWPNPGFDGGFLPVHRKLSGHGYTAEWSVPFIARGIRSEGLADFLTSVGSTSLGISFVELADPYQSVSRSLKYVLLFLGLVFLTYFVFEVTSHRRVHPAQYALVGLAQVIFYLLLLSFSERTGFGWGFLIAGGATAGLLSLNAGWIFQSAGQSVRALILFTLLYSLIYLLLTLEDYALLVGAITAFLAIAGTMYLTRRIDWYGTFAAGD